MARTFIALKVQPEAARGIRLLQESIGRMPMEAKLVEEGNLHVTLTFLGEIKKIGLESVCKRLDAVCSSHRPFTVKTEEVSLIPDVDRLRVVALSLKSGGDALENLRRDVVSSVGGESHPAHLTLARVRSVRDKNFVRSSLSGAKLEKFFQAASVFVVESRLSGSGPKYKIVHKSDLSGGAVSGSSGTP